MRVRVNSDHILALTVFALLVFGLIMITSIGVPKSIQLSAPDILYPNCSDDNVDCYLLFKNHLVRLFIGIGALLVFSKIPYTIWRKLSIPLFGFTFLALITVLSLGTTHGTIAKSWISFFNASFQPAEFAKLTLIFYFAHYFERKSDEVESFERGFLPFVIISSIILLPILLQPDLGSGLVIISICVTIYFLAGARIRHLAVGALIAGFISMIVISNVPHVNERFSAFLKPSNECSEDYCWQTQQAKIAVGSGGLWGRGLAQGVQKSYWLPQATDDFVFAASAEELGFLRITFIVLAFTVVGYRGFQIANHAPNRFAMLLASGITAWILIQAFMNISVNIGLFPVTGITLPFISYGGSSLLSSLIGIGILLNISKHQTAHAYRFDRRRDRRSRTPKRRRYRRF
jgi:cell division protein FtsW